MIDRHLVHDRRWHTVRHLPVARRATRLVLRKRLLICVEGCGTFVERTPSIAPAAVWSRAAARAAVAMSEANVPVDTIRKSFGVGWNTVLRAVLAAAELVACSRLAASARIPPASSQRSRACRRSITAKSADHITSGAELVPPNRRPTSSLSRLYASSVEGHAIPPSSPSTRTARPGHRLPRPTDR